jgi:2-polyprenyl-3-methyl-5-hydroxy-6-metoxy-1,4-benzoquinol methylase
VEKVNEYTGPGGWSGTHPELRFGSHLRANRRLRDENGSREHNVISSPAMSVNRFEDPAIAPEYDKWYTGPGKRADALEKELLAKMLALFPRANSVLDVGCGTGHFSRWLASRGFQTIGLGPLNCDA